MSLPRFDPWNATPEVHGRAYRAYRAYGAYPGGRLGTLGTIGTHTDFHGGISVTQPATRTKTAERVDLAAECLCCRAEQEEKVERWRKMLVKASGQPGHSAAFAVHALSLVEGPWIYQLMALGWDEASLFAVPDGRDDPHGLIYDLRDGSVVAAGAQEVRFWRPGTTIRRHGRSAFGVSAPKLVWGKLPDFEHG